MGRWRGFVLLCLGSVAPPACLSPSAARASFANPRRLQPTVAQPAADSCLPCHLLLTCSAVDVVCREGPRYVLELAKFGAEVR